MEHLISSKHDGSCILVRGTPRVPITSSERIPMSMMPVAVLFSCRDPRQERRRATGIVLLRMVAEKRERENILSEVFSGRQTTNS